MAWRSSLFVPRSERPYPLSRSRLERFLECPRCFYLDRRLGVDRPSWPAFTLNSAVDVLLKKEFDVHRAQATTHSLMKTYGINAVPFQHPKMGQWRENFNGVRVLHQPTNLVIFGAIDDLWLTKDKQLLVVDYKATSTSAKIDLNDRYKQAFKRQLEIYQWLLRQQEDLKDYQVSDLGYFVYANAKRDEKAFDAKLEFAVEIIPYQANASWVEGKIIEAHQCLLSDQVPDPAPDCEYCQYRAAARKIEKGGVEQKRLL